MAAPRSRTILIAGAGIGGLTAALAIVRLGYRVVVLEQAARLEEAGAGIQLSPNALHVLRELGLAERLAPKSIEPTALRVRTRRGRDIVTVPFGQQAHKRYGAPYWLIHRADLQRELLAAVSAQSDITLRLGAKVEEYAVHANGVTVEFRTAGVLADEHGIALIGADGLWSTLRNRLGDQRPPRFRGRTAWRATVAADFVAPDLRAPMISLWLGSDAHLVHYPISGGASINIVAIVRDRWREPGWSAPGDRRELLSRFKRWSPVALSLLTRPDRWAKWALFDRAPISRWGDGTVTLLGDAAHPAMPFLAQGAAMAIEDAFVLAQCLKDSPQELAAAMRRYEGLRVQRVARIQRTSARNGLFYHLWGPAALARNHAMRKITGEGLLARHDWVYAWRPEIK